MTSNRDNAVEFEKDVPILVMERLCKSYELGTMELKVLRDVELTINNGDYVAIMGPSGSGKSTLLNMIGCLDRPTSGDYWLGGQNVSLLDDDQLSLIRGARIGFIFQSFNLINQLNVVENIEVPMYYQGYSENESAERARELAALVGLADRLDHRPTDPLGRLVGIRRRPGLRVAADFGIAGWCRLDRDRAAGRAHADPARLIIRSDG